LRAKVQHQRLIAVVELGSNTMRAGVHGEQVLNALRQADHGFLYVPPGNTSAPNIKGIDFSIKIHDDIQKIVAQLTEMAEPGDHILIMSNKGFGGIHTQLLHQLTTRFASSY
jgi:UDP-N-acetylmuramate: L-alanyl-gamma-D-glutamyl-meso-diaminopimelate ligase